MSAKEALLNVEPSRCPSALLSRSGEQWGLLFATKADAIRAWHILELHEQLVREQRKDED